MNNSKLIFETDRLIIRDFTLEDIEVIQQLVQEPEIYKYQHWGPNAPEDTSNFINMAINQQKESPRISYEMAIVEKETKMLLGAIGIRVKSSIHKKGDIGYWVRYDNWGKGIMTEAAQGVLKFGFEKLDLNKISATAAPLNIGSLKVLEKIGMSEEGFLKSDLFVRGNYRDSVMMAILKNEWLTL
jgi:ribosomal-protein-alanine N-acetyltransferase